MNLRYTCPNCGTSNDPKAKLCQKCGYKLRPFPSRAATGTESGRARKLLVVRCSTCGDEITVDPLELFQAFACPACRAVYTYENANGSVQVSLVRPGSRVPKEIADACSLLGIEPTALSEPVIRSAWRKRIDLYHPDKVARMGQEIRELAETKTRLLNDAMEKLVAWVKGT